jgi:hypothetical protein
VDGEYPPPPPAKKSKAPWVIAVAVIVVLALVAGGIVAALTIFKKDSHAIAVPSSAGGMKRDKAKETELKQQLDAAEQQFKTQGKNVSYVRSAVFDQADTERGPKGSILFLGAKLKAEQNPATWIEKSFIKPAESNGLKIDKISAGDGGGSAACAYLDTGQKGAICAWATKDSIGEVVPVVPGYDRQQVAKLMLAVREDVETNE